MLIGRRD